MKRLAVILVSLLLLPISAYAQNLEIWCIWADGSSGTGCLVRGPNGTVVLLDEGGGANWASYCKDVMDANSISYIDYAIACHYDSDHVGGLDNLWTLMGSSHSNFGAYYDRGGDKRDDGSDIPSDYFNLVDGSTKRATPDIDGADDIDLGSGATLRFLSMGAPNETNALYIRNRSDVTTGISENNKSISVLVTYGGFDFYFGSDLEGSGEKAVDDVVVTDLGRGVDVLHVDHHGSETYDISSAEFLGNMDPEVAVISVWNNSFGHPRYNVVDRLQDVVEADTQRIIRLSPGDTDHTDWAPESMSYCHTTNDHVKITVTGSNYYTITGSGINDPDLTDHAADEGGTGSTTTTTTTSTTTTTLPGAASVVINEIAWSGTASSYSDEWIELYNTTDSPIDIANWSIDGVNSGVLNFSAADGSTTTVVPAGGYLIYANDQDVFSSGATEHIWDATINISDSGGQIVLYNAPNGGGTAIDTANDGGAWFFGDSGTDTSMERKDPAASGTSSSNWADFSGTPFAQDADSNDVNGSPGALNSAYTGTTTTTSTTTTTTSTTTSTTTTTLPPATHLLITEVAVDSNQPSNHDWIEIYLPMGASSIDVSGVYITDLDDDYQVGNNGTLTMQPGDVLIMHDASGTSENDSSGIGANGFWDVYFGTGPSWASTDEQLILTTEGSADPDPANIIDAMVLSNDDGYMQSDARRDGNKLIDYNEWGDPTAGSGAFTSTNQGPAIGDINDGYAQRTLLSDSNSVGDWEISATQDQGTPPAGDLPGDLDVDNDVDTDDLSILVGNWGSSGTGDIDESGTVEEEDLGIQMSNWTG